MRYYIAEDKTNNGYRTNIDKKKDPDKIFNHVDFHIMTPWAWSQSESFEEFSSF